MVSNTSHSVMTPEEQGWEIPSAATIDALARQTLARLPSPFRESLGDIVFIVEEMADSETVSRLGLSDPMQLSGLYEGVPLTLQSVSQSGVLPERVTLYLRSIVEEWRSTNFSLEQIVAHIVIHEIGHHFGFSDDDMHALEQEQG